MRFLVLFLFFLPFFVEAIIITEVQISGERADDCYIKIYNSSNKEINLGGYSIRKRTSTGGESSVRSIPQGSTIKPKEYFIWASSRNEDFPQTVSANIFSKQYLSKNNSIAILDGGGRLVDALSWGSPEIAYFVGDPFLKNPEKGQVLARKKSETYQDTKNNSSDFYLYPPPPPPANTLYFKEDIEEKKKHPILISFSLSAIMGLFIIFFKKWLLSA